MRLEHPCSICQIVRNFWILAAKLKRKRKNYQYQYYYWVELVRVYIQYIIVVLYLCQVRAILFDDVRMLVEPIHVCNNKYLTVFVMFLLMLLLINMLFTSRDELHCVLMTVNEQVLQYNLVLFMFAPNNQHLFFRY